MNNIEMLYIYIYKKWNMYISYDFLQTCLHIVETLFFCCELLCLNSLLHLIRNIFIFLSDTCLEFSLCNIWFWIWVPILVVSKIRPRVPGAGSVRDDGRTTHFATGHQVCMPSEVHAASGANQRGGAEEVGWTRGRGTGRDSDKSKVKKVFFKDYDEQSKEFLELEPSTIIR